MTKNNTPALVKEPYSKTVFKNEEQLSQFMKCCDPVTGPMYFMDNFFMIQHPTKGSINYHPWDFQRRLIHTYHTYRNTIALMPRQTGKCFGINTIVNIRNIITGKTEDITIGELYERHFSSKKWKNGDAGLYRLHDKENNRVRQNILTRARPCKSNQRANEGPDDSRKRISNTSYFRRNIQGIAGQGDILLPCLSDTVERKFIDTLAVTEYEIYTDTGWQPLSHIHKTIPYQVWTIITETGLTLECADTHILFDHNMEEIFAKDLTEYSFIRTINGIERVKSISSSDLVENMFDVTVDDENHRFYSNGILSHNSTSAAGYLLWYAMFVPDSTILIAAHKYAGAQEIMHRIRYAYENCPDHIKAGCTTYNKGSIDFDNGSRIISATTTENTGRGMSITLLYIDEFAFVRPSIATEFWTSITPTLSTGGKCIITSTPNSDEDQFALIWKGANKTVDEFGNTTELGINGFKAYRAYWYEHPERGETYEKEMRSKLGDDRFRREVLCEFLIAEETLINPSTLIELEGIEPVSRMGQVRWYRDIRKGSIYTVALDPSLGTGGDPAAIQIYDAGTTEQIGEWTHNRTDIPNQIKLLAEICKHINEQTQEPNNIYYSIENNGIGEAAIVSLNEYGESNIPGIFLSEPGKRRKGFNTTNKPKLKACAKLKTLIESKKMKVYSKALISELKTFVANSTNSYSAKAGETDDLVMATILSVRMMTQLADYHGDLEARIRDHDEIIQPLPFFAVLN